MSTKKQSDANSSIVEKKYNPTQNLNDNGNVSLTDPSDIPYNENDDQPYSSYTMKFGFSFCQSNSCQQLNNPKWLTFFFGIYIIIESMIVSGFTAVVITALQTRFELNSLQTGSLSSVFEVSAAIIGIVTSYYANQGHKGRYLATSAIVVAVGAFVFVIPHFAAGLYVVDSNMTESDVCSTNATNNLPASCSTGSSSLSNFLYLFILAEILIGAGNNVIWTTGMAYVDENVSPTSSSMYLAILTSLSAIGPALGFLLGGVFLDMWVDWPADSHGITQKDPRWVGAWWLGYVIGSIGMLMMSIPLFAYPRQLATYAKSKAARENITAAKIKTGKEYGSSIKDFPKAIMQLIDNKTYIFTVIASTLEGLIVHGFAVFLPKFVQSQFFLTSSSASLIVGIIVVPGVGGGLLLGGAVMKHFKMTGLGASKINCIAAILGTLCCVGFFIGCDSIPFAGANTAVDKIHSNHLAGRPIGNLTGQCNKLCGCLIEKFDPVCGIDNITYFSPCFAGCKGIIKSVVLENQTFSNCTCISTKSILEHPIALTYHAQRGLCPQQCSNMIPFLVVLFFIMFSTYFKTVPVAQVVLRTVPESQRSFALGLQWLSIRLLGDVPGPLLIGTMIDSSCSLWNIECEETTSCWLYDNRRMSYMMLAATITFKGLATIFFLMAWYSYKIDVESDQTNSNLEPEPLPMTATNSKNVTMPRVKTEEEFV